MNKNLITLTRDSHEGITSLTELAILASPKHSGLTQVDRNGPQKAKKRYSMPNRLKSANSYQDRETNR